MPILLLIQTAMLLLFWYFCFRHSAWHRNWLCKIILFLAPFVFGCIVLWLDLHHLPLEVLRQWHNAFCCFSTLVVLLLLPQWYKLMWLSLTALPVQKISENTKLLFTTLFSVIMMLAIIFFFALYFLWLDSLSGYTQGLRSAYLNFQPVLLDFPTAFFFSFSCYFSLGYGAYYPYGNWFYLLVFLECLIALINNGIIIFYAFHLLFERK
ncbi:MAG: hypothetical protein IKU46_07645 [Peptococcaceae bacterium]|nr:hypothetical protein [Peptococcaceae bacterium]